MRADAVQIIKDRLTTREVIERYGFETDRKAFVCCPFHNEKTASMKIYNTSYYCFGCHASGDVIKFVQTLFNLSFPETLKKIDVDFNLNVLNCSSFEDLRRSRYQQRILQAKRDKQIQKREKATSDYWNVFDEWKRLTDNKVKYAPKMQDEEFHPLFIEALKKIAYQEYLLDCAEIERRDCEK